MVTNPFSHRRGWIRCELKSITQSTPGRDTHPLQELQKSHDKDSLQGKAVESTSFRPECRFIGLYEWMSDQPSHLRVE